jgi:hypothetical protein
MSHQMSAEQKNDYSLYIPTLNKKYNNNYIIYLFWKFTFGNIDRIDFVPIMKPPLANGVSEEDPNYHQAFIYIRPNTEWGDLIIQSIETNGSYRFYPHKLPHSNVLYNTPNEFWIILKNNAPIPYSNTRLNVHQLVNNNSLLEAKLSEMETEMAELKKQNEIMAAELKEIKDKKWLDDLIARQEAEFNSQFEEEELNALFEGRQNYCDCQDSIRHNTCQFCMRVHSNGTNSYEEADSDEENNSDEESSNIDEIIEDFKGVRVSLRWSDPLKDEENEEYAI